jgi:hypothetical protein
VTSPNAVDTWNPVAGGLLAENEKAQTYKDFLILIMDAAKCRALFYLAHVHVGGYFKAKT